MKRLSFYNTPTATEHYLGIRWPKVIWMTVLEQAVRDATVGPDPFENAGQDNGLVEDIKAAAREWIADTVNEPRRFEWVCEQLDLNPAAVRLAIRRKQC